MTASPLDSLRAVRAGIAYPHIIEILRGWDRPGGLAIEIGCGGSQYAVQLRARHIGTDLPGRRYAGSPPAVYADGRNLPFRTASADLIFMVAVLYHITEVDTALAECVRVLKPGGTLLVFDYNHATTKRLNRQGAGQHVWSPRALRQRVTTAGLVASSIWDYTLEPDAQWKRALLRLKAVRYLRCVAPGNEGWNIVMGTKPDVR